MSFPVITPKSSGWRDLHCSVEGCKNKPNLANVIEVDCTSREPLKPKHHGSYAVWSSTKFTPCAEHIDITNSYLTALGFSDENKRILDENKVLGWIGAELTEAKTREIRNRKEG